MRCGGRFFCATLLLALASLGYVLVAARPALGQGREGTGKKGVTVALKLVQAPSGDYALALPPGWVLRQIPGTHATLATPPDQQEPVVYVLPAMRVSDLRYEMMLQICNRAFIANPLGAPDALTHCIAPAIRAQIADSSFRWTPGQAVRAVASALAHANPNAFGVPKVVALSANEALYRVPALIEGKSLVDWGHATIAYLQNPLLSSHPGVPGVTSLAFVAGCEAPAASESAFRATCAGVLRSLRFERDFVRKVLFETQQAYQREVAILLQIGYSIVGSFAVNSQIIQETSAAVRQMQWETFNQTQAARLRTTEDWMNALAGTSDFVDRQSGEVYNFNTDWHTYRYNCVAGYGGSAAYYASDQYNCAELSGKLRVDLRPINPLE